MPAAHAHSPMPWKSSPSRTSWQYDEFLVAQDVAVGVEDALREPGGPRRVVELRRIVGPRCRPCRTGRRRPRAARRRARGPRRRDRPACARVLRVGDDHARLGVPDPVPNALVAVQTESESRIAPFFQVRGRKPPSRARRERRPRPGPRARRRAQRGRWRRGWRGSAARPSQTSRWFPRKSSNTIASLSAGACRRRPPRCCSGWERPTVLLASLLVRPVYGGIHLQPTLLRWARPEKAKGRSHVAAFPGPPDNGTPLCLRYLHRPGNYAGLNLAK